MWAGIGGPEQLIVDIIAVPRERDAGPQALRTFVNPHNTMSNFLEFMTSMMKLLPYLLAYERKLPSERLTSTHEVCKWKSTTEYFGQHALRDVSCGVVFADSFSHVLKRFVYPHGSESVTEPGATESDVATRLRKKAHLHMRGQLGCAVDALNHATHLRAIYAVVNKLAFVPIRTQVFASTETANGHRHPVIMLQSDMYGDDAVHAIGGSATRLVHCMECILELLVEMRSVGLVHRDVRWPNIMRVGDRFTLVDCDDAAFLNPNTSKCEAVYHTGPFRSDRLANLVGENPAEGYGPELDVWSICDLAREHGKCPHQWLQKL